MNNRIKNLFKKGYFIVEIQSLHPENLINILWKSGIDIKNAKRESIAKWIIEVNCEDYDKVKKVVKENKGKIKIIRTKGILSYLIKIKKQGILYIGVMLFFVLIYGYSCYIWNITIETGKYLSPFEVRKYLLEEGIKPGVRKNSINVYDIEKKLIEKDSRIMWVRARFEGSRFKVDIEEKQNPPKLVEDNKTGDVVAKMDGEILRVYTINGTAIVDKGQMVKAGDVLIKGEQGKEGATYETPAKGDVIAKTFYEDQEEIDIKGVREKRTGKKDESIYIEILGKKLYIKKCKDKFAKYDKIEDSRFGFKTISYYEVEEEEYQLDHDKAVSDLTNKMQENMKKNLDKKCKIIDTIVKEDIVEDKLTVKVVFIVEQNIADRPTN